MAENEQGALQQVHRYQQLVLQYEALDREIDALIMTHGGGTENMSPEALSHYRELAYRRDDIQNEMRALEQELNIDE